MTSVMIKNRDEFMSKLRLFKRLRDKTGLPARLRTIQEHVSDSEIRRRAKKAGKARLRKKLAKQREVMEQGRIIR